MNYGHFSGRLGRDAVTRTTPGGKEVCNFSIGVSVGYGEKKETLWIDCALWGERGKKLAQYLTKGSAVSIAGEVGIRSFEGKNGHQSVLTCNVQAVTLIGGGERKEAAPPAEKPAPAAQPDFSDDIPF